MLGSITRFSLRFPWLIVAASVGLIALGYGQISSAPKDLLPEFTPTTVEVQTEALGLSAYEVEQLITVPLEQDLLNGIAFLDSIESASLPGLSSVVMIFEPGTDLLDARQVVQERLTQAVAVAGLPNVADAPQMIQPLSSTSRVALVSLSSDELTQIQQSVLARWVIIPRLLGVEGVANVSIFGFRDRQLQVLVNPETLAGSRLDLSDVIRTAGNALEVSPLTFLEASSPGTGGFIDTVNQRLHVFHEQSISTPEELAQVPIEDDEGAVVLSGGRPLTLGEVTTIVEDHQPLIGDARCGDGACLLLVLEKFPEANTPEVTAGIDTALEDLAPGLQGLAMDTSIYRPADFIETSLSNLGVVFLIGGILLILVIGLAYRDWRTAVVSVMTIAASIGAATTVLVLSGVTINAMILAGLAMALVAIVDDAAGGVGLLLQRAEHHRVEDESRSVLRTVLQATVANRRPAFYATMVVVAALVPFFFMEGEIGAFFPSIAGTYLAAIAVGLLVSLTAAPALAVLLLRSSVESPESERTVRLKERYRTRSERRVGRITPAVVTFSVFIIAGVVGALLLTPELRPSLQERDLVVKIDGPPGMSLPRMDEITAGMVEEISAIDGVDNIAAHVGRAIKSDQVGDVNSAEIWVSLSPEADYVMAIDSLEDVSDGVPEVSTNVSTYSDRRVTEVLGRSGSELVVRVYGEDDAAVLATAEQVRESMAAIGGVESAAVLTGAQQDTIEIEVDILKAQGLGLKPGDIRRAAATMLSGITVGNLFEEQKVFDVVVWGEPEIRETPEDVSNLLITTPTGQQVPLSDVADVRIVASPSVIRHESVSKFVDVTATVDGREVGAVAADMEAAIGSMTFPLEVHAAVQGGFSEEGALTTWVLTIALAVLVGIYLLFQSAFASWRLATLAILAIPMGLTGAILLTLVFSRELSLGVVAGSVAILGLATRWVISLIKRYQEMERRGEEFGLDLVARGTSEQLLSIAASGLAIAAFFVPAMVMSTGTGLEIVGPMAVAVVGGVVTTLLLALLVLPAAYLKWGYIANPDMSAEDLFTDFSLEEERV